MATNRTVNVTINYKVNSVEVDRAKFASQQAQKATDELRRSTTNLKNENQQLGKSFGGLQTAVRGILALGVTAMFAQWLKQVVEIRGQFQKFEAVLTNTLGSRSQALIALGRINEFARTTPFGVAELTDSFIKLANRGIQPTIKEMRAIADLSATLGKPFQQVVEAILDINNPERWKEIGVKAQSVGDKVRLTFRGVTQEVQRTERGVTDAIVALGQLNNVAGSTEAISRTLTGQTSNLRDEWELFFNSIGKANEGVLFDMVGLLSSAIAKARELVKSDAEAVDELQSKILGEQQEKFIEFAKGYGTLEEALKAYTAEIDKNLQRVNKEAEAQSKLANQQATFGDRITGNIGAIEVERQQASKKLKLLNDEYLIYQTAVIPAIQEYIDAINGKSKADKDAARQSLAKKEAEQMERLGKAVNDYLTYLSELEMFNTDKILEERVQQRKDAEDRDKESAKNSYEHKKYYQELWQKKQREAAEEEMNLLEEQAAKKRRLEQEISNLSSDLLRNSLYLAATARDEDVDKIQNYYDRQIELAGDNDRAVLELRMKQDQELEQARQRQKEADKREARTKILIDGLIAIGRIFADYGWPAGIAPAAIMAAITATNVAQVRKYKHGKINIDGPGTSTSDSIPAMLSRGESVIPADKTRTSMGLLNGIMANKIDDRIMRSIDFSGGRQAFSDDRLVNELQAVKAELRRMKAPDLIQQGSMIYEVHKDSDGNKKYIRSKSI